jgi:hypothetical protein
MQLPGPERTNAKTNKQNKTNKTKSNKTRKYAQRQQRAPLALPLFSTCTLTRTGLELRASLLSSKRTSGRLPYPDSRHQQSTPKGIHHLQQPTNPPPHDYPTNQTHAHSSALSPHDARARMGRVGQSRGAVVCPPFPRTHPDRSGVRHVRAAGRHPVSGSALDGAVPRTHAPAIALCIARAIYGLVDSPRSQLRRGERRSPDTRLQCVSAPGHISIPRPGPTRATNQSPPTTDDVTPRTHRHGGNARHTTGVARPRDGLTRARTAYGTRQRKAATQPRAIARTHTAHGMAR